uniref:Uncharacterized protein n=1 Tax=Anguilla anguilla TaxID=7936 RepID=A0A0E9RXB6_ANGAN
MQYFLLCWRHVLKLLKLLPYKAGRVGPTGSLLNYSNPTKVEGTCVVSCLKCIRPSCSLFCSLITLLYWQIENVK